MRAVAEVGVVALISFAGTVCMGSEDVPGSPPSGFGGEIDRAVAQLRKATAPFRSIDQAHAVGYKQETECVERQPDGAMGYHFGKKELRDGLIEIEKPEVLLYEKRADGSFKFNGVEYIVPLDAWKQSDPPTVMGQAMKRFDQAGFWYLHVWAWEPNPSGLFADWNPSVKCPDKSN
jgi:hypothetical protein